MKDFRQLGPGCKQTLELPISASSKLAQCPACETTFTAGEKLPQTTADAASAVQSTEEYASLDLKTSACHVNQVNHVKPSNQRAAQ